MGKVLALWLLICIVAAAQEHEVPKATELSGNPFFIKRTWFVGGAGQWDYLAIDGDAQQLFVAHGSVVQVVDVKTGAVAGEIVGLREAHTVALDDVGEFGYISDGRANDVKVFDRRSFRVVATIPTVPNPRALVFEPRTKLLFAVCTIPPAASAGALTSCTNEETSAPRDARARPITVSSIGIIDTESRTVLGRILLAGKLGFAQSDGRGKVYVSVTDRNRVLRLDADAIAVLLRKQIALTRAAAPDDASTPVATLDWSRVRPPDEDVSSFSLPSECLLPVGLAVDGAHSRLFAACNSWKLAVINASSGDAITSLTTGPGTDAIAYDASRGFIFSANGGGYGEPDCDSPGCNHRQLRRGAGAADA